MLPARADRIQVHRHGFTIGCSYCGYSTLAKSGHRAPHGSFIVRNLLRALGCQFIEPIDELGITAAFDAASARDGALGAGFNALAEERRRPRWEFWRDWRAFPGSNGLHYNLDPRQCALDFSLHAGNLGIQKRLQLLEFGR